MIIRRILFLLLCLAQIAILVIFFCAYEFPLRYGERYWLSVESLYEDGEFKDYYYREDIEDGRPIRTRTQRFVPNGKYYVFYDISNAWTFGYTPSFLSSEDLEHMSGGDLYVIPIIDSGHIVSRLAGADTERPDTGVYFKTRLYQYSMSSVNFLYNIEEMHGLGKRVEMVKHKDGPSTVRNGFGLMYTYIEAARRDDGQLILTGNYRHLPLDLGLESEGDSLYVVFDNETPQSRYFHLPSDMRSIFIKAGDVTYVHCDTAIRPMLYDSPVEIPAYTKCRFLYPLSRMELYDELKKRYPAEKVDRLRKMLVFSLIYDIDRSYWPTPTEEEKERFEETEKSVSPYRRVTSETFTAEIRNPFREGD